jgi:hypothetical protein
MGSGVIDLHIISNTLVTKVKGIAVFRVQIIIVVLKKS